MSETVDHVARAIFYAARATGPLIVGGRPGEPQRTRRLASSADLEGYESVQSSYHEMAQAALHAMRKPTVAMSDAYIAAMKEYGHMCEAVWEAMIDAALEKGD